MALEGAHEGDSGYMWPASHNRRRYSRQGDGAIAVESANHL